jgi:hypothetical protein
MAGRTFVSATLVADTLHKRLEAELSAVRFANRKFEGIIKKKGSVVTVEHMPFITPADISDLGTVLPETRTALQTANITIAQAKGVNEPVRDIEEIRASVDLGGGIIDAIVKGVARMQETHFLATIETSALAGNRLYDGSPVTLTTANITQYIGEMAVALTNQGAGLM